MNKIELTWESVSSDMQGAGLQERRLDTSGGDCRAKLPDSYFDQVRGFPAHLINTVWMLTYVEPDHLAAIRRELWGEFVRRLRFILCDKGRLSGTDFQKLHIDSACRVQLDNRKRWRIPANLVRKLRFGASDGCILVFQPREAVLHLMTWARHHEERQQAERAEEELRTNNGCSLSGESQ